MLDSEALSCRDVERLLGVSPSQAKDQALAVLYGSGTTISDQDLGSAIAVQGN